MGQTRYEMGYWSNHLLRWLKKNKCERQSYKCIHDSRVVMPGIVNLKHMISLVKTNYEIASVIGYTYTSCESKMLKSMKNLGA